MLKSIVTSVAAAALLGGSLQAAEVDVTIVNMTGASYFTPLLVSAHPDSVRLFETGMAASDALQAMAEGGDISGLGTELQGAGANVAENPAGGMLMPGHSATATVMSSAENDTLSLAAMILPTNDGFVALNGWKIPEQPGTYHVHLSAYDAGTEGNDEIVNGAGMPGEPGIPADPGGHNGSGATGVSAQPEGFVHIHRGILGDQDANGGVSDLNSSVHRWLNPVATAIITVK